MIEDGDSGKIGLDLKGQVVSYCCESCRSRSTSGNKLVKSSIGPLSRPLTAL